MQSMNPPSQRNPKKRKASDVPSAKARPKRFKRQQNARNIVVQSPDEAMKNGELDVAAFVKAREFEIYALERSMMNSKSALTTRAFQKVPRDMRRRTASHNAKRVPKRLRARAKREMREDNTPTVTARRREPSAKQRLRLDIANRLRTLGKLKTKQTLLGVAESTSTSKRCKPTPKPEANELAEPLTVKSKFRRRQIHKTWLPTHIWHTKRAHMTDPKDPLWRFVIPLSPTQKSYRSTHRASTMRGAIAWDTSYMSTVGLKGVESAVVAVLKAIGFGQPTDAEPDIWDDYVGRKWRNGKRSWTGWVYERDGIQKPIAPVTVVWRPVRKPTKKQDSTASDTETPKMRELLVRVHPSAFLQLWNELLSAAKTQSTVTVEDLRFEIGSIEIVGPEALDALVGALTPIEPIESTANTRTNENEVCNHGAVWQQLRPLTNMGTLPPNVLLSFEASDPRLRFPPHRPPQQGDAGSESTPADEGGLIDLLASWPADDTISSATLFDRDARIAAAKSLPNQQAINHRKAEAPPGEYPPALPDQDPHIPVLALSMRIIATTTSAVKSKTKNKTRGIHKNEQHKRKNSKLVVLLPWECVLPLWHVLLSQPLRSGGTPHFGGLTSQRQLALESGVPWFPGDFPGTAAGQTWEKRERMRRYTAWKSKPPGKRVAWESVRLVGGAKGEVGKGWACDWAMLGQQTHDKIDSYNYNDDERETPSTPFVLIQTIRQTRERPEIPSLRETANAIQSTTIHVSTIKLRLFRGSAAPCARIYRLPTTNSKLKAAWMQLNDPRPIRLALEEKASKAAKRYLGPVEYEAPWEHNEPPAFEDVRAGEVQKGRKRESRRDARARRKGNVDLAVPGVEDIVGFVTCASFNLGVGACEAIGSVVLSKMEESKSGLCIVRNAGASVATLAQWEVV